MVKQQRCPYCLLSPIAERTSGQIIRSGRFYRKSDGRWISRFLCKCCGKSFSNATQAHEFRQNKRNLNFTIFKLLNSGVSMRRLAKVLGISRTTVARKLVFQADQSREYLRVQNSNGPKPTCVEFDDVETFEHSRSKALSIIFMVESKTRRLLFADVAQMSSKKRNTNKSKLRYGKRRDNRREIRRKAFINIKESLSADVVIKSDKCINYAKDVCEIFPQSEHLTFESRRSTSTGYGELKKGGFDPLFALNHTGASFRDSIKRLSHKTWCTTKKQERLRDALAIYAHFHNSILIKKS